MTDIAPPSTNPSNTTTVAGMLREVLHNFLMDVDDMLPAQVLSYDRASNVAKVRPLIMVVGTDLQNLSRAEVSSVPVLQIGGGSFMLNFPINPGDLGWIKANDRDISHYKQSLADSPPNTYRKHDFSDGLFIPQVMRNWTINAEDSGNVVLSTVDGTQRIAIATDHVKITSSANIILDAPLTTITGNIVTGTGTGTHTAIFNGNMTLNGQLTATVDVVAGAGNISLVHHVHGGVLTGGGNTGAPV